MFNIRIKPKLGRGEAEWSGNSSEEQGGHLLHCGMGEKNSQLFQGLQRKQCPQRSPRFPLEREGEEKKIGLCQKRDFVDTDNEFLGVSGSGGRKWGQKKDVQGLLG